MCGIKPLGIDIESVVVEPGPLEGFNRKNRLVTLGSDFGSEENGRSHDYWTFKAIEIEMENQKIRYQYHKNKEFVRLIGMGGSESMCSKKTVCCGMSCLMKETSRTSV